METLDFLRLPVWYRELSGHTFPTSFLRLPPETVAALSDGESEPRPDTPGGAMIRAMRPVMAAIPGNCFVCVDGCAPTDTERFYLKRGAVYSPESAWRYLASSAKVRNAARNGKVEYICLKPFRRMNQTREFRLFILDGELVGMSQYHLIRHFRRLEGVKQDYWNRACAFFAEIKPLLPIQTFVMDIYFTSELRPLVIDLNEWANSTDPLLFMKWQRDWKTDPGIRLMPPPTHLSGEVSVSF